MKVFTNSLKVIAGIYGFIFLMQPIRVVAEYLNGYLTAGGLPLICLVGVVAYYKIAKAALENHRKRTHGVRALQ